MNIFQALVLGIVEGITEFLPISSTGHLILTTDLLHIPSTEFVKSFTVLIQSGAILAVVLIYWRKLLSHKSLVLKVLTAFIPTAIIGFILYSFIKHYLLGNTSVALWALFLGGIALILLELWFKKTQAVNMKDNKVHSEKEELVVSSYKLDVSYKQSFLIGVFQSISIIPGTSRALTSIFGGMVMGLGRRQAVEFSFLLAIPTMFAATTLDLLETSFAFTMSEWLLLAVGFLTSFVVAYVVIKWFIYYISQHTFTVFGVYRIVLSIILYIFLVINK